MIAIGAARLEIRATACICRGLGLKAAACPHRLEVRTPPFQGGNGGSIPPGDANPGSFRTNRIEALALTVGALRPAFTRFQPVVELAVEKSGEKIDVRT